MKKLLIVALLLVGLVSCTKEEIRYTEGEIIVEVTGGDEAKYIEWLQSNAPVDSVITTDSGWYRVYEGYNPQSELVIFSTIGGHTFRLRLKSNETLHLTIHNRCAWSGECVTTQEDWLKVKVYRMSFVNNAFKKILIKEMSHSHSIETSIDNTTTN